MSLRRDVGFGPGAWGPLSHRRRTSFVGEWVLLFRYLANVSALPHFLPLSSLECAHVSAKKVNVSLCLVSPPCFTVLSSTVPLPSCVRIFTPRPPIILDLLFCLYVGVVSQFPEKGVSFITTSKHLRPYFRFCNSMQYTLPCIFSLSERGHYTHHYTHRKTARVRLASPNRSSAHVKPNLY